MIAHGTIILFAYLSFFAAGAIEENQSIEQNNIENVHLTTPKEGNLDVVVENDTDTSEEFAYNITAQLGSSVFLECKTHHSMERQVSWIRRSDWHILTTGTKLYTKEERFFLHHPDGSTEWTLEIKYAKLSDEGIYECQIATGDKLISQLVSVRVIKPRAAIVGSGEYHIDRGSTIKLECVIKQTLKVPQFIFWYHNDRMINYDADRSRVVINSETPEIRSNLTVTDARPSDSGNYTCDAANTDAASAIVYVTEANNIAVIQTGASDGSSSLSPTILILGVSLFSFQFNRFIKN